MNLQIRDPDVRRKAEELARRRKTNLTEAVRDALDYRLDSLPQQSLHDFAKQLNAEMRALSTGRDTL